MMLPHPESALCAVARARHARKLGHFELRRRKNLAFFIQFEAGVDQQTTFSALFLQMSVLNVFSSDYRTRYSGAARSTRGTSEAANQGN
jgi:hypothetical protein